MQFGKPRTVATVVLLVFCLLACGPLETLSTPAAAPRPTVAEATQPPPDPTSAGSSPAASPTPAALPPIPTTAPPTQPSVAATAASPPGPLLPEPLLARRLPTTTEFERFTELSRANPPARDDIAQAVLYGGLDPATIAPPPVNPEPQSIGTVDSFQIANHVENRVQTVDAELLAVSDHAYFWFEIHPEQIRPTEAELRAAAANFDAIYEQVIFYFGSEDNPGIDGDSRVYIMHATNRTLCGDFSCVAGYVPSGDVVPVEANPDSNEHEMFVLNSNTFGTTFYLDVLAHEFRHMIESNHDAGDWDWAVEGSAMLASVLLGYDQSATARADLFLSAPDRQLNSWPETNPSPGYGHGYLLNLYLFERLGIDLYREYAVSPLNGLEAITAVAAANGLPIDGETVWLDWLVAVAVHDRPETPPPYQFDTPGLRTAATEVIEPGTALPATTVGQYAADYYTLPASGQYAIEFVGSTLVPVLDVLPAAGSTMWLAQRSNYSEATLTRAVDLRGVASATLEYDVYYDIEAGYDFGYLFVSTDDGQTWSELKASGMQSVADGDDPSGSALTTHFYTGRSETWQSERIDLTPYAGQEIMVRFTYVTDPILTLGGLALDNIAIPELGFTDSAELPAGGWVAAGWTHTTAYLPQQWRVQLVTFNNGALQVIPVTTTADQSFSLVVDADASAQPPLLIVAAVAPQTLEPAFYRFSVNNME